MREQDWGLVCVGGGGSNIAEEGCLDISGGTTDVGYGEGISTDETWV